MEIGVSLHKIRRFLEENNADVETMKAFDDVRNYITKLIYRLAVFGSR